MHVLLRTLEIIAALNLAAFVLFVFRYFGTKEESQVPGTQPVREPVHLPRHKVVAIR